MRKKSEGGEGSEKRGRKGGGVKNTEAGDEARDEKGRAVFSFHVMKHLLRHRTSPAEPSLAWYDASDCDTVPPAHLSLARGYRQAANPVRTLHRAGSWERSTHRG